MSELLETKINAVRSKYSLVEATTGAVMAIGLLVSAVMVGAFLDWFVDFPWLLRAVFLLGYLGATGYVAYKYAIVPVIQGPSAEELALCVEQAQPDFATRLIASVQMSDEGKLDKGVSRAIVGAMIRETERMSEPLDFASVIKLDRLFRFGGGALGALCLGTILLTFGGETSRDLLGRVFLSTIPVPTKTKVECLTKSYTLPRGDNALISARATGWKPVLGKAEITYESGRVQTLTLDRAKEDNAIYAGTLDSVQESFSYRVRIYDGKTETFQVKATPRPAVVAIKCEQIYPAYTGMGTVPRSTGDMSLVVGSKLRLNVSANKPVRLGAGKDGLANRVLLYTADKAQSEIAVGMQVNPAKRTELTVDLPLSDKSIGFSIQLVDEEGVTSKDPAIYRIDMVADRPPQVRLTSPERREVLVTRTQKSELNVGFVLEDDYRIGKAELKYRIDEGDVKSISLGIQDGQKSIRGYYPWKLIDLPLPPGKTAMEGSVIEFWVEAEDTNNISGPGKTESEHYQARVVSLSDKQKELIDRMAEQLTAVKSAADNQNTASEELGTLILEQPKK